MKADFSRVDLRGAPDEWLQQQGRLWLDSDWNEAVLARLRRLELHARDLVGPVGRPEPATAFRIADAGGGNLSIGGGPGPAGHLYVAGVLATNAAPTTYTTQPGLPSPPPLPLPSATGVGWQLVGDMAGARTAHGAILLPPQGTAQSRVLVCGGTDLGAAVSTAELYDPVMATWTSTGAMSAARAGHTVSALGSGRVLAAGGLGPAGLPLTTAEVYDPATGTWTATGPMPTARFDHTATVLTDGRVLVAGGFGPGDGSLGSISGGPAALASAEVYDPATGTWADAGAMIRPRGRHAAVGLASGPTPGAVLVCGGEQAGTAIASVEIFDPATGTWAAGPDMAGGRENHTADLLVDGRVLVAGGTALGGVLATCEIFDPAAGGAGAEGAWLAAAPLANARTGHAAARLLGGHILATGGLGTDRPLASAELYDPGADRWTIARSLAEARGRHRCTVLSDGSVLVSGGTSSTAAPVAGGELPSAELLDPVESTVGVAYVEVFRRLVTHLQEDRREIALGGADTTVHLRTVAQVRVAAVPTNHVPATLGCSNAAAYVPGDGAGRLSTITTPSVAATNLCDVPADRTYSGRDNRLYRVEILDSGEMLGALAPAGHSLVSDAAGPVTVLHVGALDPAAIAALRVGRWDLVAGDGPSAVREAVRISGVDASGTVTLAAQTRHASYTTAAGAMLVPVRDVARLAAAAAAGDVTVTVVPGEGPDPAEAASGALSRRGWFLRTGAGAEPVSLLSFDAGTGTATLASPLREAYPAGAELVPRARYTWSTENASFASAVTSVVRSDLTAATTTVQVAGLGPDRSTALRVGDLVELVGDADELGRGRGLLCRIAADPDPDTLTVTLDAADPRFTPDRTDEITSDHLVLRRWDGIGYVGTDPADLDDGVRIRFSGYDFRATSYWWFTARAREAQVEKLDAAPPNGIQRHRAPLAVLHWSTDVSGTVTLDRVTDCVPVFDPLTDLQARHVQYDDSATGLGADNVQGAIEALAPQLLPRVDRGGISWANDRPLPVASLNAGLTVRFTESLEPATLTDRTVEVWLHVPDETDPFIHAVRLPGIVAPGVASIAPGAVSVTFRPRTPVDPLRVGAWQDRLRVIDDPASQGVRAVVVLRAAKILDASGTRPLDGEAFARLTTEGYGTVTDLRLPSGDGRPGSDFESWFFLTGAAAPVRVATVDPPTGSRLDGPPAALHVMFTRDVRRTSLTAAAVSVTGPEGGVLPGTVAPFPFTPGADAVSGLTLTPSSAADWSVPGMYTLRLSASIVDLDGGALDGVGNGTPSDFVSTFFLDPFEPGPVRVLEIEPADSQTLQEFPDVIRVRFTRPIRPETLDSQTVNVIQAPLEDPVGFADVPGTITLVTSPTSPPRVVGFTFAPTDRSQLNFPGLFGVRLRGTGSVAIRDFDGNALDGESSGGPSDFRSFFEVGSVP